MSIYTVPAKKLKKFLKTREKESNIITDEMRIAKMLDELNQLYVDFHKEHADLLDEVYLSKELLEIVVISIVQDFKRFESYTGSQVADCHKYAAFVIKWISKIKPIQMVFSTKKISKYTLLANSSFAIFAGIAYIDNFSYEDMPIAYHKFLMYSTYYRNISGRQLAGSMYLLEENAKLNKGR